VGGIKERSERGTRSKGTSRMAFTSALFSSKSRILKASSRDILTLTDLAFTAALCLASVSQQQGVSADGAVEPNEATPGSEEMRV
jgi:hypothetical protein